MRSHLISWEDLFPLLCNCRNSREVFFPIQHEQSINKIKMLCLRSTLAHTITDFGWIFPSPRTRARGDKSQMMGHRVSVFVLSGDYRRLGERTKRGVKVRSDGDDRRKLPFRPSDSVRRDVPSSYILVALLLTRSRNTKANQDPSACHHRAPDPRISKGGSFQKIQPGPSPTDR